MDPVTIVALICVTAVLMTVTICVTSIVRLRADNAYWLQKNVLLLEQKRLQGKPTAEITDNVK